MVSPQERLEARSQLMLAFAVAFAHPEAIQHAAMQSGDWQKSVSELNRIIMGDEISLPLCASSFTAFEATYIDVFNTGNKGKPKISLCASGYPSLLQGDGLPEFLLRYSRWYHHFGVDTREGETGSQPADHLFCQLEFMAWLAHLEARSLLQLKDPAAVSSPQILAYQRAQRDFLQRELIPTINVLSASLQEFQSVDAEAIQHLVASANVLQRFLERCFQELDSQLGPAVTSVVTGVEGAGKDYGKDTSNNLGVHSESKQSNKPLTVNIWD